MRSGPSQQPGRGGRSRPAFRSPELPTLARTFATCLVALGLLAAAPPLRADDGDHPQPLQSVFEQVDSMLDDLRGIMGFGPEGPLKLRTITRVQFRNLYQRRMREARKPSEIHGEVAFLRMFGLVPESFDYEKTVLDLLGEQAWALYDYKRRTLYLSDWTPPEAREFALLHELVHAVDDRQFGLRQFVEGAREAEQELARLAVVEGQASWVMTEWVMRQSDRSLLGNRMLAIATASATRFEAEQFPVYESTPLYFREVLIFPYTDGLLFQDDMVKRFGTDGLKRVFEDPPESTQHIIQPELYLNRIDTSPPALARIETPKGFRTIYDGAFGQLDHRILLQHHLGDENRGELLDKWRGSQFEVLEHRRSRKAMLKYAVRWDDEDAASEYYHLYRQLCERKWNGLELVDDGRDRCRGTSEIGTVVLELDGTVVRSVEGLPVERASEEQMECCND